MSIQGKSRKSKVESNRTFSFFLLTFSLPGFGFLRLILLITRHVSKPVPQPADEDGRGDDGSKTPRAQVTRVSRARQTLEDQPVQAEWKHRVLEAQRRFVRRDPH